MSRVAPLALVVAAILGACTDTATSPTQIVAIEFDTLPYPSVLAGDTLRDSLGRAAPLHAIAFNGNGTVIANPALQYITLDSTVAISPTGYVTAQARSGSARIIASAPGLQSITKTLLISRRPDTVIVTGKLLDTLRYALPDDPTNVSASLSVRLATNDTTGGITGSSGWLVSYQAFYRGSALLQKDTSVATLWDKSSSNPSALDTTSVTDGSAGRRLRIRPVGLKAVTDSFVVIATVKYRGAPVKGSPVRFVLVTLPK
jgi:hypothetical protein